MYGLGRLPAASGAGLVVLGLVLLAAFVQWERRAAHPLLDMALFAENRVFAFSNLAALINYAATFAVGFLLSLYFQSVRGLSPQATVASSPRSRSSRRGSRPWPGGSPTAWTRGSSPPRAWA
jgi:hypothetical protein